MPWYLPHGVHLALSFKSERCCQEGLAGLWGGLCPSLLSRIYSSDNTTRFFSEEADWPGQIRVTVIGWTCTQAHDPGQCSPRSLLGIRVMKGGMRAEGGRTDASRQQQCPEQVVSQFLLSGALELLWLLPFTRILLFLGFYELHQIY